MEIFKSVIVNDLKGKTNILHFTILCFETLQGLTIEQVIRTNDYLQIWKTFIPLCQ